MNYTENLSLNRPTSPETYSVQHWNENMDILDDVVDGIENDIANLKVKDTELNTTIENTNLTLEQTRENLNELSEIYGLERISLGRTEDTETGYGSIVYGNNNEASQDYSVALGKNNKAQADGSFVIGVNNTVTGNISSCEGSSNTVDSTASHVEGLSNSIDSTSSYSHVEGQSNSATGFNYGHIEGYNNSVTGNYNHVEGSTNNIVGSATGYSHIEGLENDIEAGYFTHVEGNGNTANGNGIHIEGTNNSSSSYFTHLEGNSNTITDTASVQAHIEGESNQVTNFKYGHAEGQGNIATGTHIHVEGQGNTVEGYRSHVEGLNNKVYSQLSHVEGVGNISNASAMYGHVEGNANTNNGYYNHVEGYKNNNSSGQYTHVEGNENTNSGSSSHLEGSKNTNTGGTSHIEGELNNNTSQYSHVEGYDNDNNAMFSHVEGYSNVNKGFRSHVQGIGNLCSSECQDVSGKYNIEDADNLYACIVGNGDSVDTRSNAYTLDWDGNAYFAGNITTKSGISLSGLNDKVNEISKNNFTFENSDTISVTKVSSETEITTNFTMYEYTFETPYTGTLSFKFGEGDDNEYTVTCDTIQTHPNVQEDIIGAFSITTCGNEEILKDVEYLTKISISSPLLIISFKTIDESIENNYCSFNVRDNSITEEKLDDAFLSRLEKVETEVIPIERGGTGATTAKEAQYNLLKDMNTVNNEFTDTSLIASVYVTPTKSTGMICKRTALSLWNYIKPKAEAIFAKKEDVLLNRQTLGYTKKNIMLPKFVSLNKTVSGVTFTDNGDGSIHVKGTSTALINFAIVGNTAKKIDFVSAGTKLTFSNTSDKCGVMFAPTASGTTLSTGFTVFNSEKTITLNNDSDTTDWYIAVFMYSGVTIDETIYPMIRSADIADDTFEPYIDDVDTRLKALEGINAILDTI